jgi:23S rRNA pseudouridine2604 synthase
MLASGVKIMGVTTKPCKVERVDAETFRLVLTQGLNRQIRRMCSALGYRVRRLQRVRIINLQVGALRAGEWRYLTDSEVARLLAT